MDDKAKRYLISGLKGAFQGYMSNDARQRKEDEFTRQQKLLAVRDQMKQRNAVALKKADWEHQEQIQSEEYRQEAVDKADKREYEDKKAATKFGYDKQIAEIRGKVKDTSKKDINFLRTKYASYKTDNFDESPKSFKDWGEESFPELYAETFGGVAKPKAKRSSMDKFYNRVKPGANAGGSKDPENPELGANEGGEMQMIENKHELPDIIEPVPMTSQMAKEADNMQPDEVRALAVDIAKKTDDDYTKKLAERVGKSDNPDLIFKLWEKLKQRISELRNQ